MRYLTTGVAIVFVTFLGLVSGMIVRGWEATPQSLTSRDDALSACVRGAASGRISLRVLPRCINISFAYVDRQKAKEKLLWLEPQLDRSFHILEESRKDLGKYMDPHQDSRDKLDSN